MDNKNKRSKLRKDFLKNFDEKDYFSCYEIAENIIKLYNDDEKESIEHCTDLYNLAYIQSKLGKHSLAIKYYKKVIKTLDKKEFDIDNPEDIKRIKFIIDAENNVGICYNKSSIKQSFSINCFERALALSKKYLKNSDENITNILHNIGCSYYDIEQYEDAIHYFLDELSIREKNKDLDFIDTLNFLGYSYEKLQKYENAIGYFNQSLEILKGLTGINSEEYIANLYYISSVYSKMENYDLAIKNYEKSCSLIEQKLGDKHPYLAEALSKLSQNYLKIDKPEEALKIQLNSLNIIKHTVGEKHMFYATALKKVGDIYYILKDYEKCLSYYEIEAKIKEEVIGIYNEEYVNSLLNLINLFIKTNNIEKQQEETNKLLKMVDFDLAKKSYEKALLILCKIYMSNDMGSDLYKIYDYYKNINSDTFDDMVKKAQNIEEDIINKDKNINDSFDSYNENDDYYDIDELEDDIFDGIKNLFDGIKREFDKIEKNKNSNEENIDFKDDDNNKDNTQKDNEEDNNI